MPSLFCKPECVHLYAVWNTSCVPFFQLCLLPAPFCFAVSFRIPYRFYGILKMAFVSCGGGARGFSVAPTIPLWRLSTDRLSSGWLGSGVLEHMFAHSPDDGDNNLLRNVGQY